MPMEQFRRLTARERIQQEREDMEGFRPLFFFAYGQREPSKAARTIAFAERVILAQQQGLTTGCLMVDMTGYGL